MDTTFETDEYRFEADLSGGTVRFDIYELDPETEEWVTVGVNATYDELLEFAGARLPMYEEARLDNWALSFEEDEAW